MRRASIKFAFLSVVSLALIFTARPAVARAIGEYEAGKLTFAALIAPPVVHYRHATTTRNRRSSRRFAHRQGRLHNLHSAYVRTAAFHPSRHQNKNRHRKSHRG